MPDRPVANSSKAFVPGPGGMARGLEGNVWFWALRVRTGGNRRFSALFGTHEKPQRLAEESSLVFCDCPWPKGRRGEKSP